MMGFGVYCGRGVLLWRNLPGYLVGTNAKNNPRPYDARRYKSLTFRSIDGSFTGHEASVCITWMTSSVVLEALN